LVKRYVEEPGTDVVRNLLREGVVTTARFSQTEIASALARRCREGAFSEAERDRALVALHADFAAIFLVELTAAVISKSVGLLVRRILRAADALQLASCLELRERLSLPVVFVAWDGRLVDAARAEGLETRPE
jgi:predicted nucleic acid-binding protein